jgi:hypothetical protein
MSLRARRKRSSGLTLFIDNVIDILEDQYGEPVYPADFIKDAMYMYNAGHTEQGTAYDLAKKYGWEVA